MLFNKQIQKRILQAVGRAEFGLTITEAAICANTQRSTARKHLERLVKKGDLLEFKKGKCRIFVKKVSGKNEKRKMREGEDCR